MIDSNDSLLLMDFRWNFVDNFFEFVVTEFTEDASFFRTNLAKKLEKKILSKIQQNRLPLINDE